MTTLQQFKKNLKNLGLIIFSQVCAAIFMFALYLLTLIF